MTGNLADKSRDELLQVGKAICGEHDWRWVAIWAYNIHRLFRAAMEPRKVWDELDTLIRSECDWHLGQDLVHQMRPLAASMERDPARRAEHAYVLLGEVAAKCLSNASWSPGMFEYNAPWLIPALAFEVAGHIRDRRQLEFLEHHFGSLARSRHADKA